MKRLRLNLISLICLFFATAVVAEAQPPMSSTVTGHITAEVINTLSAIETSQLSFGKFSPGPQGGDLILTPQNTISVLGSCLLYTSPSPRDGLLSRMPSSA